MRCAELCVALLATAQDQPADGACISPHSRSCPCPAPPQVSGAPLSDEDVEATALALSEALSNGSASVHSMRSAKYTNNLATMAEDALIYHWSATTCMDFGDGPTLPRQQSNTAI